MSAYAMAYLHDVDLGAEIVEYLQRIDATLEPFGGHFLVHGATPELLEGDDPGLPIVIEFPSLDRARGWYDSPAYREILPLRTRNARSTTFLIDGVDADHKATDVLVA
jgi:uncharacterized protein (DUF1330 family)